MRDLGTRGMAPLIMHSPNSGIISMLPAWPPARQIESDVPHSLRPEQKFSVPSIGSSTATHSVSQASRGRQLSSPMKVRPGRRWRSRSAIAVSRKVSAAVTGLPSGFQVTS